MSDILLNGKWDFMPVYGEEGDTVLPGKLEFSETKINVPSVWKCRAGQLYNDIEEFKPYNLFNYPDEWNEAEKGVLRTFFSYEKKDERCFLKFDAIMQTASVYLNGVCVAKDFIESFLPLEIEVTNELKEQNELIVVCSAYKKFKTHRGNKVTGLWGSWFSKFGRGIWQDVHFITRPNIYIADISYNTSVRNKKIEIVVSCEQNIDVEVAVGDLTIHGKTNKKLTAKWENPILWDIDNPYLYKLTAKTEFDEKSINVGFREFWIEKDKFILNGTTINLRGDSWHFQGLTQQTKQYAVNWFEMAKSCGANYIRLHAEPHPEYYLDAADEVGILLVSETAIYGSAQTMDAGNNEYIKNCHNHVKRLVKRDKNHPSVVIWSLQNEMRWVTGRDVYKNHIGDLITDMKNEDIQNRAVIMEGDNRLYPKEKCEAESYHYNIDGTIGQWDRNRPLTYGEHGGWWYICPQNSSMYVGLKAYTDFDNCSIGIAEKERLFIEYARKVGVNGVSTFNFAHYFATSMPNEDIYVGEMRIPKYSLTINNGYLKDYPAYIPNLSNKIVAEAYKAVTVFAGEYNTAFYKDEKVKRSFYVFNDTRRSANVKVVFEGVFNKTYEFEQQPGEKEVISFDFAQSAIGNKLLKISLYHDEKLMHQTEITYKIFEKEQVKTNKIIGYFGNDKTFEIIKGIVNCQRVELKNINCNVLILGDYLEKNPKDYQNEIKSFTQNGGVLVSLEQNRFALGKLIISHQKMFGVHINDNHPVLNGICDEDLRFWQDKTKEEEPLHLVENAFVKPEYGDVNMILESSRGDFGDGGDLWSPLMEIGCEKGRMILNQLEIIKNLNNPIPYKLLVNMIKYAVEANQRTQKQVMVLDINDDTQVEKAKNFDGSVLVLPTDNAAKLEQLIGANVSINPIYTYQLKTTDNDITYGVSKVDLFGFEKVHLSPRFVENHKLCDNTIEIDGAEILMESIVNTPWEDYFVNNQNHEYCKMALININKDKNNTPKPYVVKFGKFVISQIKVCSTSKRIYDRMLSNLGAFVDGEQFLEGNPERINAVEYFMVQPHEDYNDLETERDYYTNPQYSLNNLGEGLYGWMKKLECDKEGYISWPDTKNRTYFATCFVMCEDERIDKFTLEANADANVYINGERVENTVHFKKGINPVAIEFKTGDEDLRFKMVFDKGYNLVTQLTIDEVEPK